ncbi:MAG TPA: arabinofuranosidase catalytic domain-containing protein [Bacteroidia bacterium]|nr:arabinofuranosidase catalytic domain-containing protein [Bacteroidia bacterium]
MSSFFRKGLLPTLLTVLILSLTMLISASAQVSFSGEAIYGLRKIVPSYAGSAILVRRTCDNATKKIGFSACGDLDTAALKAFVVGGDPVSAISTSSQTAYSLRIMRCTYAGKAVQVRRSSDNTTQDIGFTAGGDLDTTALLTFVGAGSGYVSIWYDQSGNGRDASQATAGKQPRIVNAGVIERQGTKPSIRFLGAGYSLATVAYTAYGTAGCFNAVACVNSNSTYNTFLNKTSANIPAPLDFYNATIVIGNGTTYTFYPTSQTLNASIPNSIWTYQANAASVNAYYNGNSIVTSSAPAAYGDAGNPLVIGSRADALTSLDGWISEAVTFAALPSTADRQYLEWTESQYYNIANLTLGTVPANAANAYVQTWYDQSGNGLDITQAATANQPTIVTLGVINRLNLWPSVLFNGTSTYLSHNIFPTGGYTGFTTNILANWTTTGTTTATEQTLVDNNSSLNNGFVMQDRPDQVNTPLSFSAPTKPIGVVDAITTGNGVTHILTATNNGVQDQLFREGSSTGTAANASAYNFQTRFLVGAWYNAGTPANFYKGNIPELNLFKSSLSTTRRTLLENNQSAFYNIAITNSKYTPPSSSSYVYFVDGVGRETATDSVNSTRSSAGMGFKVGTAATDFLKDNGDYLMTGINCPIAPNVDTLNYLPATVKQHWINDWYLQKTDVNNNGGNVTVYFDFTDYAIAGAPSAPASNYVLLARSATNVSYAIVAGTTPTVSALRVSFLVDAANLTNHFYYTIGTKDPFASPLPIELLSFHADVCEDQVCLSWKTASETNNRFFTVEKTKDGINFVPVKNITGSGNSSQVMNYASEDPDPYDGVSYYRLKQTDFNGKTSYAGLAEVQFDASLQSRFFLYPNPNKGVIQVNYKLDAGDNGMLNIYNLQGVLLQSIPLLSEQQSASFSLDLKPGLYFCKYLVHDTVIRSQKMVVVN